MARFVLTAVFVALVSVAAFAGPPSLVIIQYHIDGIVITHGVGQTEKIATLNPEATKNYQTNIEQMHTLFTKIYAEGYVLQNSSAISGQTERDAITTYVFVKP